jgi:hypothetical protein
MTTVDIIVNLMLAAGVFLIALGYYITVREVRWLRYRVDRLTRQSYPRADREYEANGTILRVRGGL